MSIRSRSHAAHKRDVFVALIAAVSVLVAAALVAPEARAVANGSVGLDGGTVTYISQANKDNVLTVTVSGSNIVLTDSTAAITGLDDADGSGGCSVSGTVASCPLSSVQALSLQPGSDDDTVTVDPAVSIPAEIVGGPGRDTINGGSGDDRIDPGNGVDVINGGAGLDTADYSSRTQKVNLSLDGAANDGQGSERDNIGADVEQLLGGSKDDTLTGNGADNILTGGPGSDILNGGGGFDIADYSDHELPVAATLDGLRNDGQTGELDLVAGDIEGLRGSDEADRLVGNSQANLLDGGDGDDLLDGGRGPDLLHGGDGVDTADYSNRSQPVTTSANGLADDGEAGESDTLDADVESVSGGSADDLLSAGDDDGTIAGNGGNDRLVADLGDDVLSGGAGVDTADYSARTDGVSVTLDDNADDGSGAESDNVRTDVENVVGSLGDDLLTGSATANVLDGGPGSDAVNGGAGDDRINGGAGDDLLSGDEGNDQAAGGDGSDALEGDDGDDALAGEAGIDSFDGGDGNDRLAARDGVGEDVACGDGSDVAQADVIDDVDDDCESITGYAPGPAVVISARPLKMKSDGTVTVRLACVRPVKDCEGTLALSPLAKRSAAAKRAYAKADFDVFSGDSDSVELQLTATARKLVTRKHKLSVRAIATVNRAPQSARSLTVKTAPKKQRKQRKRG